MSTNNWSGQFVVFDWPFTDQSKARKRAALVLSEPDAHGDLQLLKVTSKSHQKSCVAVESSDLASGALKQTSYIRIDHALAANESLLKPIGVKLKPRKLAEVHKALALASTRQFSRLSHSQLRPATDP